MWGEESVVEESMCGITDAVTNSPHESPIIALSRPVGDWPAADRPAELSIETYQGTADQDEWLRIQNELLAERRVSRMWGPAQFHRQLSSRVDWHPDRLLLARVGGDREAVATAVFWMDPSSCRTRLQWLLVRPGFRRRGIARELVAEVGRRARAVGRTELRVETLRAWHGAVGFYTAIGFREVPLRG